MRYGRYGKLWLGMALVIAGSFLVLGYFGREIYQQVPPIPQSAVASDGRVLFTAGDILEGQAVWLSIGGQEVGSIWGHGACLAPDWSADWLHREAAWLLEHLAESEYGAAYPTLEGEIQAALRWKLQKLLRANTYDPKTGILTVSPLVARAFEAVGEHYAALFGDNPALDKLRNAYALPALTLRDPEQQAALNAFFFWTAWACVTERPGKTVSYTQNWPPDDLVGNRPGGAIALWSVVGMVVLLAGIGALGFYYAMLNNRPRGPAAELPQRDPLLALRATPSMKATTKFFWAILVMIVAQVLLGVVSAHYGLAGGNFHGLPLSRWLPNTIARTWHLQLALFWIATAWMATGTVHGAGGGGPRTPQPEGGGEFPLFPDADRHHRLAGRAVVERAPAPRLETNFWFGHQGLEYIDLGRMWQFMLLGALAIWVLLMSRAIWPALGKDSPGRHLLALFLLSAVAITLLYGAGLAWRHQTNLAIIEYWRWWVVHLWIEGFFEVFATVVIAFLFTRMGLLEEETATVAVLFTTTIFLGGAIVGTFHHLYFSGTPVSVLALGSSFSALEVVPLVLLGLEGYANLTRGHARPWVKAYQWPIYFFVAVAFWNLVGAGLFGFAINTPIALYYMQGLNTTPVHSHTALFGIYGMLGIGLMLFCLKGLTVSGSGKRGCWPSPSGRSTSDWDSRCCSPCCRWGCCKRGPAWSTECGTRAARNSCNST